MHPRAPRPAPELLALLKRPAQAGGVTCAEVSGVRFLAKQHTEGRGSAGGGGSSGIWGVGMGGTSAGTEKARGDGRTRHYIVGTTRMVSGDSLLASLDDPLLPVPPSAQPTAVSEAYHTAWGQARPQA